MQEMRQRLTSTVSLKKKAKSELVSLRNRYIAAIYGGLSKRKTAKQIHKDLWDMTMKSRYQSRAMLSYAMSIASKAEKRIPKESESGSAAFALLPFALLDAQRKRTIGDRKAVSIIIFDFLDKRKATSNMSKIINAEADKVESQSKEQAIKDEFAYNRGLESPKVFYLASEHKDSAEDHEPYQGKIYIDEEWRSVISDREEKARISSFLQRRKVKTVQWLMGKPVWFITRPNCRHYIKPISTDDVLGKSRSALIKENDMSSAIGDREYLQTIKHATSRDWYEEVRNAELLLEKYKERLTLHEAMSKQQDNPLLSEAIRKDRILIRKWEDFIREKRKAASR